MPGYRFYRIGKDGHVAGPPVEHDAPTDLAAIQAAKQFLDSGDIEIWQGPRVVAYLTPDSPPPVL